MGLLVRISGKTKDKEFCAGMVLTNTRRDSTKETINHEPYQIKTIAPILKSHFMENSPITLDQIKAKCKREQWLLELIVQ